MALFRYFCTVFNGSTVLSFDDINLTAENEEIR